MKACYRWIYDPLLLFFLLTLFFFQRPVSASTNSYIVYFGAHSQARQGASLHSRQLKQESHYEFLGSILGKKEKARDAIFYSYTNHINAFAATLEDEQVAEISKRPGVISVIPNRVHKLHTTRSWEFLGLEENGRPISGSIWEKARFGEDAIIGVLDTGVWPESESFNDVGMGPIPSKWKGTCEAVVGCNRKLIGAQSFNKGFQAAQGQIDTDSSSAVDTDGHGTHALSTAGGSFVPNANLLGNANGTAKGGSPRARVAAYKACWPPSTLTGAEGGCYDADILAAIDAAIHDGVDVISVSLGSDEPREFFEHALAIGSFHATRSGISVVCSAGNGGPVVNVAPWVFTVAASTMDRKFTSYLSLGNKLQIKGGSLSPESLRTFKPMISSIDAVASSNTTENAGLCLPGSLDPNKVKGKIVVCLDWQNSRVEKGIVVLEAGGVGMVVVASGDEINVVDADIYSLPALHISFSDGATLFSYLNSTLSPSGFIARTMTNIGVKPAPVMADFSSQGPNTLIPGILKPDITAPGVNVLAAYTGAVSATGLAEDTRIVPFNIYSGTSMSCPHISGIVGLLKSLYPDWSPSAIKSAIMTTATTLDNMGEPIKNASLAKATPFDYGSGHVNPNHAMDPGLVYDLTPTDYLNFLCSIGYNTSQIAALNYDGSSYSSCPTPNLPRVEDLNYPSITISNLVGSTNVPRVLKNVGSPGTYKAYIEAPRGVAVSVSPDTLSFEKVGEEHEFEVSLRAEMIGVEVDEYAFGMLRWSDGSHDVSSPIVVKVGK